jgi:hypothetical protein
MSHAPATTAEPRWFLHDLVTIHLRGEATDGHMGMVG